MPDSNIPITSGAGTNVDTRTAGGEHRQVIVAGDPATTDSVAVVRGADPISNDEGLVVRDVNTSAIVSGLRDVRVQSIVDGTVSVENLTRVRNVVDGTISNVYRVHNLVDGTISNAYRVHNVVDGTISNVYRVFNLVDGTLSTVQRVQNVVDGTLTTVTGVDRVRNVVDGTLTTVTGVDRVRNVVDGTLSTVQRVQNIIDGTLTTVTGVDRVRNVVDGTLTTVTRVDRVFNLVDGTITTVSPGTAAANLGKAEDAAHSTGDVGVMSLGVRRDTDAVSSGASGDYEPFSTDNLGRLRVVNMTSTGVIPATVSSSASGISASGNTVVSPIASSVIKVYAFSITTTAQVGLNIRFTNGAGTSPTEFWRVAMQAPTAPGIAGANLAVTPPGYLWATAAGSTLSLLLDSGSLVHYSVAYFRESA